MGTDHSICATLAKLDSHSLKKMMTVFCTLVVSAESCHIATKSKGCFNFRRTVLKKDHQNMHFNVRDLSLKVMMDLIRAASDICITFGICGYLGKIYEVHFESQRNTAPVILTPKKPGDLILSRPYAAEN